MDGGDRQHMWTTRARADDPRTTQPGTTCQLEPGLALAAGEWITFIDTDDCWAGDKLAVQTAFASPTRPWQPFGGPRRCLRRRRLARHHGAPWHGTNLGSGLFRRSSSTASAL